MEESVLITPAGMAKHKLVIVAFLDDIELDPGANPVIWAFNAFPMNMSWVAFNYPHIKAAVIAKREGDSAALGGISRGLVRPPGREAVQSCEGVENLRCGGLGAEGQADVRHGFSPWFVGRDV